MSRINHKYSVIVCVVIALTACSPSKTSEQHLESAKVYLDQNKKSEAKIELKNAVLIDLNNGEARFQLGLLYLNEGDAVSAEKELQKAIELQMEANLVLPYLLKSLNLQDKNQDIIDAITQFSYSNLEITPEILLYKFLAYRRLGEFSDAKQAIEQANEISAESSFSLLGNAYIKVNDSDVEGALKLVERVVAQSPDLTDALLLQGQLNFANKNYNKAIESFLAYQKQLPNDLKIKLFLSNAYIKNEQFDFADEQLILLLAVVPEHAFTNQLKGVVEYKKQNYQGALHFSEKAIQNSLNIPANRMIAGISAYQLKNFELAYQYLISLSKELPSNHLVKRVLAIVQIQLGYNIEAAETLETFDKLTVDDVSLLADTSFELLTLGEKNKAASLINKVNDIEVGDSLSLAKLGILKLSIDDLSGIADLENAIELGDAQPTVKVALANAYIQSEEYEKALSLAIRWQNENPNNVEGFNLAAKAYFAIGKKEKAIEALNQALKIEPNNVYSLLYFSAEDIILNKPQKAIDKLNTLLEIQPYNTMALIQYYQALDALGKKEHGITRIKSAFDDNMSNIIYRLLYAQALASEQKYESIIELLTVYNKLDTNTPKTYWKLLGLSYYKLGIYDKALTTYSRWIELHPSEPFAWIGRMITQERLNDYSGALSTVERYIEQKGELEQVKLPILAYYQVLTGKFEEALSTFGKLTNDQKSNPIMQGVQGQILMFQGKYLQALEKLEIQYNSSPSPRVTSLLYKAMSELGQEKRAFYFLKKHVELHDKDINSQSLFAQVSVKFDKHVAQKNYQELLEKNPDNIVFINNLAWVEYELFNYEVADELIKKALIMAPENYQVLDTAALVQWKLGNIEHALAFIAKAKKLAPNNKNISEHYSQLNTVSQR